MIILEIIMEIIVARSLTGDQNEKLVRFKRNRIFGREWFLFQVLLQAKLMQVIMYQNTIGSGVNSHSSGKYYAAEGRGLMWTLSKQSR